MTCLGDCGYTVGHHRTRFSKLAFRDYRSVFPSSIEIQHLGSHHRLCRSPMAWYRIRLDIVRSLPLLFLLSRVADGPLLLQHVLYVQSSQA